MSLGQVSFEKPNEWEFITTLMRGAGIQELWTSGRLCDAEVNGCDAPHYQPLNINGWFWASTLVQMLPCCPLSCIRSLACIDRSGLASLASAGQRRAW